MIKMEQITNIDCERKINCGPLRMLLIIGKVVNSFQIDIHRVQSQIWCLLGLKAYVENSRAHHFWVG